MVCAPFSNTDTYVYITSYNIITEQSLKRNAFGDLGNECMAH